MNCEKASASPCDQGRPYSPFNAHWIGGYVVFSEDPCGPRRMKPCPENPRGGCKLPTLAEKMDVEMMEVFMSQIPKAKP